MNRVKMHWLELLIAYHKYRVAFHSYKMSSHNFRISEIEKDIRNLILESKQ